MRLGWGMCIFTICMLGGCATSRQITGPSGEVLHAIDCSGYAANIGMCLEKAGKICGSYGYELLFGDNSNLGQTSHAGTYGYFSTPVVKREMVIRCKGGPGTMPKPAKEQQPDDATFPQ